MELLVRGGCLDMALLALRYGVTSARRWRATQDSQLQKEEIE